MLTSQTRQKFAIYGLMFLPGFTWASWVSRTPVMRDSLSATTEMMGMILFGFSCGSMFGVFITGKLIAWIGARRTILYGILVLLAGVVTLMLGLEEQSRALTFISLMLLGAGTGMVDIVVNVEGAAFEQTLSKSIMTVIHGFFSLGTLVGALAGMAMTALDISTLYHFIGVLAVIVAMTAIVLRHFPTASAQAHADNPPTGSFTAQVMRELRDRQLLILGVVILAMALAEGSANDWLPLIMIDGHNLGHTASTLVYVGFTAGMTAGRFLGGYLVDRLGRVWMLRASAVSAAVGLVIVIFVDQPWLVGAAVLFWGIGASLGFPLTVSAAAEGGNSAVRVTIAATLGYFAFLVGPPFLGFLGEHAGLRLAMLPVLVMVLLALFCSGSAKKAQTA